MSGESDANKEFVEQLRMQELYGQRNADGSDPYTYTDPVDGTVYDWDHEKKAWFPKVRPVFTYVSALKGWVEFDFIGRNKKINKKLYTKKIHLKLKNITH